MRKALCVLALALMLVLAPGCDDPQPSPMDTMPKTEVRLVAGPEIEMLEAVRDSIADAYDRVGGKFVCQTRTWEGGTWISIDVATLTRGGVATLYVREPASAWGDSITCYEGVAPVYYPGVNPVNVCTTYEQWSMAIDLVIRAYPWDRADIYGNGNWDQLYLEWGDGWRCFMAIATPSKPDTQCDVPPYFEKRRRSKPKRERTSETGRGEQ